MGSVKFVGLCFTLALFTSAARSQEQYSQSQFQGQINRGPRTAQSESRSAMLASLEANPDTNSLSYHSAIESSSLAGYSEVFSNSVHAATAESTASSKSRPGMPRGNNFDVRPFNHVAIGLKASTLGAGIEIATPLSRSFNLRGSFNYAVIYYPFDIDGINYTTDVNFRSGQIGVDWFPFHGGFHVSPGLLYFRNTLAGQANVPPGRRFTLNDTDYINSVDDPVSGTASVNFSRNVAPVLTVGWGNLIPRSGRHFSVPFEIGAAYTGAGIMDIKLAGTACTRDGCFNAATDPGTQANLKQELKDLNDEVRKFQLYPVISLGFAFRF